MFFKARNPKIDAKILNWDLPKRKSKSQYKHFMTLVIFHILYLTLIYHNMDILAH